jgi:hypothetical protein
LCLGRMVEQDWIDWIGICWDFLMGLEGYYVGVKGESSCSPKASHFFIFENIGISTVFPVFD